AAAIAAGLAVEGGDERGEPALWRLRRARHRAVGDGHAKAGPRYPLDEAGEPGDGQALAVEEDDLEVALAVEIQEEDAAANPDRRHRRLDRHRCRRLAELAADIAEDAARRAERLGAGAGLRVVDELVDRHVRIRSDAHRRFVDEQNLRLAVGAGGDVLVEDDIFP